MNKYRSVFAAGSSSTEIQTDLLFLDYGLGVFEKDCALIDCLLPFYPVLYLYR